MLIYKIVTPHSPKCYVGMTNQTLKQRMSHHRGHFREWQQVKQRWCSSYGLLWLGDCTIELLEETDDKYAEARWIQKLDCVNNMKMQWGVGDLRDVKSEKRQWRMKNKERLYHQKRVYRQVNEKYLKACKSEKIPCDRCGFIGARQNMSRHQRSARCIRLTAAKDSTTP